MTADKARAIEETFEPDEFDAERSAPTPITSTPKPVDPQPEPPQWPAAIDEEPLWEEKTWSGLPMWHCLWKVRHPQSDKRVYELACNKDFWSHEDLMAHIRDDH